MELTVLFSKWQNHNFYDIYSCIIKFQQTKA
jgi:hypothetical protein